MSNLLEQAIIDANALKEAAIKNAESFLLEKHSKEFKETIQKLLEFEAPNGLGAEDPLAVDPLAAAGQENPGMPPEPTPQAEPMTLDGETDERENDTAFAQAKPAHMASENDDDQVIEINFDDLGSSIPGLGGSSILQQPKSDIGETQEANSANDPRNVDALSGGLTDASLEEELQLEEEEEEEELEESEDAEEESETEELEEEQESGILEEEDSIQLSEEELAELEESLKVDVNVSGVSNGYMGTTQTNEREQRNLELAAARDEEATALRNKEAADLSDLKKELAESKKINAKLMEKLEVFQAGFTSLKENMENLSVSNAKLLYTNKVLGNGSLNERQKSHIVENISKATSVVEAKTIYNALQSSVQTVSDVKQKESLSEAVNRNQSPFLTRKKPAAEPDFADRMKILAGIK